jgi:DNA-binding NtrC family response regulator
MLIRVLIVEDESLIRWSLRQKFEERGYRVVEAETGKAAIELLDSNVFDLVMLDYRLPDITGTDVLRHMRETENDAVVIMMTAYSTIENAVETIKLGAFDYVPKPFEMEQLLFTVDKALETTRLRREVRELRRNLEDTYGTDCVIGESPAMRELLETIQQIGPTGASTVLLRGETGTGKDLVARVIHRGSDRKDRPFVNITCTALSETLLESELFGYERGAFTDAKARKRGLLEVAEGGTVFLDEIGDMPPSLQAKLLRFLEDRCFRRVGGTREIHVDVRVIAATNRDIQAAIKKGDFREDLYYRLNVVTIDLPPLRARGSDIVLLTDFYVARFAREFRKTISRVSDDARDKLQRYSWPGNVRELRNVVERSVLLTRDDVIDANDVVVGQVESAPWTFNVNGFRLPPEGFDLDQLSELEAAILRQAMERTGNNQAEASRLLNISRSRLRYRLEKLDML